MILVTGAAGKTGLAILRALRLRGATARALIHRPGQEQAVREAGAHEVLCGDLRDESTLTRAVEGVQALYHICPNISPHEVEIGRAVIAAAQQARPGRERLERFIYHSVLHPQTTGMPHHRRKLRVEELLFESALPCTILQPTAYMQNLLPQWRQIADEGVYTVPYSPASRLCLVDLKDVATVAAKVLTEEGHLGATYELCGPENLDQNEVAAICAEALGRPVCTRQIPWATWRAQTLAKGLDEDRCETLLAMFRHYDRYGLEGNSNVLRWLLGHEPAGLRAFVAGL